MNRVLVYNLLLAAALLLPACGDRVERICPPPDAAEAGGPMPEEVVPPVSPAPLTPGVAGELWASGPHARTDLREQTGVEQDCQGCHIPLDIPGESTEVSRPHTVEGVRPDAPIGCAVCHPQEPGQESHQFALLIDPGTGDYRAVDSGSALCEQCHTGEQPEGHLPIVVSGVHEDLHCLDCHDAHSGQASCTTSGCHQPFQAECEPIPTHDKPHAVVTCTACHASGEVKIEWDEERQAWHSFFPVENKGEPQHKGQHAHNLSREVICERCHTPGQLPWMEGG